MAGDEFEIQEGDDIVARSVKRAIVHIKANPGVRFEFNTSSIIKATNSAGKVLDKVLEGNEGHSGASFGAAFGTMLSRARQLGFAVVDDEASGNCSVLFAGVVAPALPPDVTTGSAVAAMRPVQFKQRS